MPICQIDYSCSHKTGNAEQKWLAMDSGGKHNTLLYMSLLAKYIAARDKRHTVVGTDLRIYEKLNFQQTKNGEPYTDKNSFHH